MNNSLRLRKVPSDLHDPSSGVYIDGENFLGRLKGLNIITWMGHKQGSPVENAVSSQSSTELGSAAREDRRVLRHIEIHVPAGKSPERIDVFLSHQVAEITRSKIKDLIDSGAVTVEGKITKPSHKIKPGDRIRLTVSALPPHELEPEPIPLKVVYEDDCLIVIDKPAGMVVHPAQGNRRGTLVNALLNHYGELAKSDNPDRPGLVHRLDKNTSGLLVVCKREPALSRLAEDFREHLIEREYFAIVWWRIPTRRGVIDKPLGRDPRDRKKYAVVEGGKPARTHWERIEVFDFLTSLKLKLETGRTHQIRVHLSSTAHPVFGDPEYGGRNRQMGRLSTAQRHAAAEYLALVNRQMLHANTLGFKHPISRQKLHFESPLPEEMQSLLGLLKDTMR